MGALRVGQGERIDANAVLQDDLQRRIAERIRPGATSESGLSGWLKRTRMVDLEETSFSDEAGDRQSFFEAAPEDLGDSPWAEVIARAASLEVEPEMARAPPPRPMRTARNLAGAAPKALSATPEPKPAPSEPQPAAPERQDPTREPKVATREPNVATREPEAWAPIPEQPQFPDLPPDSPLAEIKLGMSHHDVRGILGAPDDRIDRSTAKAWIPFYNGPGAYLRDWIYQAEGRVVFSRHDSSLVVLDVIYDPHEGK
jgi:hypothetical protein